MKRIIILGVLISLASFGVVITADESVEIPESRKTNWFHKYIATKRELLRVELELINSEQKLEELRNATTIEELETVELLSLFERIDE